MTPETVWLPNGRTRIWLRVAGERWADPLDPSWAKAHGGRWNPPGSFDALYLNGDVATARAQVRRMLQDTPATEDDLDDSAPFVLVPATIPTRQPVADAVSDSGLSALGLPLTYPLKRTGRAVPWSECQPVGRAVRDARLRGVWCRSAATPGGPGRELAWFPARPSSRAQAIRARPLPYGAWRHAESWADLSLPNQRDPT